VETSVRRAEIVGVLTAATALALGQMPATLLVGTLLSMAFARRFGWSARELETIYWYGLVRYAGCHAENHMFSALVGDEIAFNRDYGLVDNGDPAELLPIVVALVSKAYAALGKAGVDALLAASLPAMQSNAETVISGHCDVAQRLGARLGLDSEIVHALGQFRERWDGNGLPNHVSGEALDRPVRLVFLCHDVAAIAATFGNDAALAAVRKRRGSAYEPALADAFLDAADALMPVLASRDPWSDVLAAEPGRPSMLTAAELEDACLVLADFCDLQLPHAVSHSRAVATLAATAAGTLGSAADTVATVRCAALLHDLGYAAIPVRSRGGYADTMHTSGDIRLHPYHGEDLIGRVPALAAEAALVGRHHEACDGSGYFRGLARAALSRESRLLAAAEAYQTALEGRFGTEPLPPAEAAARMNAEVKTGRLDGEAVKAVLAAAGHRVPMKKTGLVAGLTNRELETLRLAASGLTTKEIAERLGISPKTADNHLQSIYAKIEVKTRAGATLFAIEHGLCAIPN
jgi:HD-GYP domain-containing protein (c-di-GMP phosphodiesterase class II)